MSENVIISVFLDALSVVAVGSTCLGGAKQCSCFGTVPPADVPRAKSRRNCQKI